MTSVEKMSKKAKKAYYAKARGMNGFNTGDRIMATAKKPSRAKQKMLDRREILCYN